MSTTTKRPLAEAMAEAERFRDLFRGCFDRWEIAGSVRRRKPEVGDVEHVIIPKQGTIVDAGMMFAQQREGNLLLHKCDELLDAGKIQKHVYDVNRADGSTGTRTMWGETYRGIDFNGHMHEIFCATPDNWGSILAIRTGPAEFSKMMVTVIRGRGLEQREGSVRYIRDGSLYPVRTEEAFFVACGVPFCEPERR